MTDLVERAKEFARAAHESIGQKRKYTGTSYYEHPFRVAELVRGAGGTDEMIAAAYLHDVVEDVPTDKIRDLCNLLPLGQVYPPHLTDWERLTSLVFIYCIFGDGVSRLVEMVTDVSIPSDGNRKARKQKDLEHLAQASPEAKTIKLADLIDNSKDIVHNDPDFAKVYMREKAAILPHLAEGNADLYQMAKAILYNYETRQLQAELE